jgi:hypothetical protein
MEGLMKGNPAIINDLPAEIQTEGLPNIKNI